MNLNKLETTPLSPQQLKAMFKNATGNDLKVIMFESIKPTDNINTLFNQGCFVVYIPVMSEYNGHFVSLFRNQNGIFFLDSYGNTPKVLLDTINEMGYVDDKSTLFRIIQNSGIPTYYNTVEYQSKSPNIADCGRYSVLNCIWYLLSRKNNQYYDLTTFNEMMVSFMRQHNLTNYDDGVTEITNSFK